MDGDGMFCPKCGTQNLANPNFCVKCGTTMQHVVPNRTSASLGPSLAPVPTITGRHTRRTPTAGWARLMLGSVLPWALLVGLVGYLYHVEMYRHPADLSKKDNYAAARQQWDDAFFVLAAAHSAENAGRDMEAASLWRIGLHLGSQSTDAYSKAGDTFWPKVWQDHVNASFTDVPWDGGPPPR